MQAFGGAGVLGRPRTGERTAVPMLRTRILVSAAAAAAATLALASCGSSTLEGESSSSAATSSEVIATPAVDDALAAKLPAKIKSAGVVTIGTDATYAPNEFLGTDGKTVEGMDVDLFNAVMAKFGVKTQWTPAGFGTIILGVTGGKFDAGVSSFTINADRMKQVTMVSYFNAGILWVTKSGNPDKIDPDNACGLSIGVQKDTVEVDDLNARSAKCTAAGKAAIKQVVEQDQSKVNADLASGKVVAMLADSPVALYAVKQSSGQFEPLGEVYEAAPYGFVLPKAETEFGQAMADALKALKADGTYTKILEKWGIQDGAITDFAVNPPAAG